MQRFEISEFKMVLSEKPVVRAFVYAVDHLRAAEAGEINFTAENVINVCPILRVKPSCVFGGLVL